MSIDQDSTASDILRDDGPTLKAAERLIDNFKYLSGVCWAPVVLVLAFYRGGTIEAGLLFRILSSLTIVLLSVAGTIYFLAYIKQSNALSHSLMHQSAISKAVEVNPSNTEKIETNLSASQRLGHMADGVAFPMMSVGFILLFVLSLTSLWA